MKKSFLLFIVMLCLTGMAQGQSLSMPAALGEKTGPTLTEELEKSSNPMELHPIIVMMDKQYEQSVMNRKTQYMDKQTRRNFVISEMKKFTKNLQSDVLMRLESNTKSGTVKDLHSFWVFNGFSCSATADVIVALAERSDVRMIISDAEHYMLPDEWDPQPYDGFEKGNAWNVDKVNAPAVWTFFGDSGYTGNGVVVAVIDTGVNYNHGDIANNMWDGGSDYPYHGYDFVNNDNNPIDDHGHGTHCSGTVAGCGTNGTQTGMAPGAKIMALKVLSSEGSGYDSDIVEAIEFAVEHGADIISMSLGASGVGGYYLYRQTFETVLAAGIPASVAAGNDGDMLDSYPIPNNIGAPGNCPPPYLHPDQANILSGGLSAVISVGATTSDDEHSYFTSVGPATWTEGNYIGDYYDYPYTAGSDTEIGLIRPDIAAPGSYVVSLYYGNNTGYTTMSGTSMATPCNAGVMALLLEANPELTPAQILEVLEATAVKIEGNTTKNNYSGSGRIDAYAAISTVAASCDAPADFAAVHDGDNVNITWTANDSATSYNIYRNNEILASNVTGTSYSDNSVSFPGNYKYYMKSNCNDGTTSLSTNEIIVSCNSVTCAVTPGAVITASHSMADAGTTVTVTVTPETGFALNTLYYINESGSRVNISTETMQFEMPTCSVTISATLDEPQLTVTAELYGDTVNVSWTGNRAMGYDLVRAKTNSNGTATTDIMTLANGLSTMQYTDSEWISSGNGYYKWGVKHAQQRSSYEIEVGTGTGTTEFNPFRIYYCYSLTQQIYTSEEIGMFGQINSVSFNIATAHSNTRTIAVYMKNVDDDTFSSWIPVDDSDKVYEGTVYTGNTGWLTITLDNPFLYESGNLMICVADNSGFWENHCYFYQTQVNNSAIFAYRDDSSYDPSSPGVGGSITSSRPNIKLGMDDIFPRTFWSNVINNDRYSISIAEGIEHGSVTAPASAYADNTVTVSVTPDEGYFLSSLYYTGGGNDHPMYINPRTKQFTMPLGDVTIHAVFNMEGLMTMAENEDVDTTTIIRWGNEIANLHYDNDNDYTGYGWGYYSGIMYWGIMIPTADLSEYDGKALTAVQYIARDAHDFTINIYEGGDNAPETLIHSQNVHAFDTYTWSEFVLDDIISIDATKNLWITMYHEASEMTYPGTAGDNMGNSNGRFLSPDGVNWYDIEQYSCYDITWKLRGCITDITSESKDRKTVSFEGKKANTNNELLCVKNDNPNLIYIEPIQHNGTKGNNLYMANYDHSNGTVSDVQVIATDLSGNQYTYTDNELAIGYHKFSADSDYRWSNEVLRSGYYNVSIDTTMVNGSVTAEPSGGYFGQIITLTVTPEEGYLPTNIYYYTPNGDYYYVDMDTKQFEMPGSDVTVKAEFIDATIFVNAEINVNQGNVYWTDEYANYIYQTYTIYIGGYDSISGTVNYIEALNSYVSGSEYYDYSLVDRAAGSYVYGVSRTDYDVIYWSEEVYFPGPTYMIETKASSHGYLTAPAQAIAGTPVTVEVFPDEDYKLSSIYYYNTDNSQERYYLTPESPAFEMPNFNIAIVGTFTLIPLNVEAVEVDNENVNVSWWLEESKGGTRSITQYYIYRKNTIDGSNPVLLDSLTEMQYNDSSWGGIAWGIYQWGVQPVYEDGAKGAITWNKPSNNTVRLRAISDEVINMDSFGEVSCGPAPKCIVPEGETQITRDLDTEAFGYYSNDYIKEIDINTGVVTTLFYVGFDVNYGQDMAMDRETNEIYWAAFNATALNAPLLKVDIENYTLDTIGYFPEQVAAFSNQTEYVSSSGGIYWSNTLEKNMWTSVNGAVSTNDGRSAAGTNVYFQNTQETDYSYNVTLNNMGTFSWSDFRVGIYEYNICKDGYYTISGTTEITNDNNQLAFVLNEITYTPENLFVSNTGWAMWNSIETGSKEIIGYNVMLDDGEAVFTTDNYMQHDVSGLESGSSHTTWLRACYTTDYSDWQTYDWTYMSCDNYAGATEYTADNNDGEIMLSWTMPEDDRLSIQDGWHYYDDGTNVDAIGTGGGNFWWAVMFPAGSFEGNMVTKVSAWDYMAMTGTVSIYVGGDTAPETLLTTDYITLTGSQQFVELELSTPAVVDPTQNVWIVLYNESGASYPAAVCANTGDANGRWVSLDGTTWSDLVSYDLSYTHMVRALFEYNSNILGTMVWRDGELLTPTPLAQDVTSYIDDSDEASGTSEYCIRLVYRNDNYSMSCKQCAFPGDGLHWHANPYLYESNMTVTGVIHIDGVEQFTTDLEVGAFCGTECRGAQIGQYFPPTEKYIVNLMVYGQSGDEITFRLYDHSQDMELEVECYNELTFEPNAAYGTLNEPYIFDFANVVTQERYLPAGNNWFSTFVSIDGEEGLSLIESGLGSAANLIKSQTQYTQYTEGYGWFGSLTEANNEQMYIINMSDSHELVMTGHKAEPAEHPITIQHEWNWIGYPVNQNISVGSALAGIANTTEDIIKSQFGYSTYYEGYGWFGSLNYMEPGRGYLIYQNEDITQSLVYPSARDGNEIIMSNITADNNHWCPDAFKFATNMGMTAVISIDGEIQHNENLEVAAICNGEVRGSARPMYFEPLDEYVAMLTVYGNQGDNLTFKLFDTETGLEYATTAKESLTYSENAIVGTLDKPYSLNFNVANGIGESEMSNVSIYPNPANRGEEIMLGDTFDRVEIFNAIGMKIADCHNVSIINGLDTAGSYIIRITDGDNIHYGKIVVK